MKVIREILGRAIQFGGHEHSGWLPANAALPQPTAIENAFLDIRILETDGGFILEWESHKPDHANDSWHPTIRDAEERAADQFGIAAEEWKNCDGDT